MSDSAVSPPRTRKRAWRWGLLGLLAAIAMALTWHAQKPVDGLEQFTAQQIGLEIKRLGGTHGAIALDARHRTITIEALHLPDAGRGLDLTIKKLELAGIAPSTWSAFTPASLAPITSQDADEDFAAKLCDLATAEGVRLETAEGVQITAESMTVSGLFLDNQQMGGPPITPEEWFARTGFTALTARELAWVHESARIRIAEIEASDLERANGQWTRARWQVRGGEAPLGAWPRKTQDVLRAVSVDAVPFELSTLYRFDPRSKILQLSETTLHAPDLGRLEVSLELSGVGSIAELIAVSQSNAPRQITTEAIALAQAVRVQNLNLHYTDGRLVAAAMDHYSARQAQGRDAYARALAHRIRLSIPAPPGHAFVRSAESTLAEFLAAPDTLSFSLQPERPMSFIELGFFMMLDPGPAIDALGPIIVANQ